MSRALFVTDGDAGRGWQTVTVEDVDRVDIAPGDLIGTVHGASVWRVEDVRQYVAWTSVTARLVASLRVAGIGRVDDFTLTSLTRCYRPTVG